MKTADIGTKRLVSLAPTPWARWLTGDATVEVLDVLSGEFQWVSRANDVLVKAQSDGHGAFLIANEIQFRPDRRMGARLRAYAALAEERYDLPVYPVVVNILPPRPQVAITTSYRSEFLGLVARQDFKVVNLWEVDVNLVFEQNLVTLLPFVPILNGGQHQAALSRAVTLLRADETIAELEPLLAFFASFVLESEVVRRIMRWDMAVLRESPWYAEILQEGIEQGIEQGQVEMLLHVLARRFGPLPPDLPARIRALRVDQLGQVMDVALEAPALGDVEAFVATLAEGAATTKRTRYRAGNGEAIPPHSAAPGEGED
ncbi:MAG TPA: hypothetical protein DEP84_18340 [Chloroflexi bacterium]|nr:hypothetical protein [Chloroflexota bacterium]